MILAELGKPEYVYFEEINDGILNVIPAVRSTDKKKALDVGCGAGLLGQAIEKRGYAVWGIESNAEAADRAASRITRVIREDLTNTDAVRAKIGSEIFDTLIFSDILEHVYDPFAVLVKYLEFLKPGGSVAVSVPNALVWTNRLNFLFGRFEYEDSGVMDKTHIRFFTFKTAKKLVEATGCRVVKVSHTPYFVRAFLPLMKKALIKRSEGVAP